MSVAITPDSRGGATITQQLVFTPTNWNQAQTVTVEAIDNQIVDGHDALVFPPMTGRVDQIRGPVIVDGGLSVNPEPFLHNPLMLPGETNLPLADGTILTSGTNADNTAAYITDPNATNVNEQTGQRPGFDPRMNNYSYTVQFLDGTAANVTLDVASVSQDILSVGNASAFPVTISAKLGTANITGAFRFIGTPDQSMAAGTQTSGGNTLNTATLSGVGAIQWTQATVTLTGLPNIGDVWTLTLNGQLFQYVVQAGDDVASRVAQHLAAMARAAGYTVEVRVNLLGDSSLLITRGDQLVHGRLLGRRGRGRRGERLRERHRHADDDRHDELDDGRRPAADDGPGRHDLERHARQRDQDVHRRGSRGRPRHDRHDHEEARAGDHDRLRAARLRHPGHLQDRLDGRLDRRPARPAAGRRVLRRAAEPEHAGRRVDAGRHAERRQLDSPANDIGMLTENTITGLGMGGDTVVGGQTFPGGITYANIESVNVALGTGGNTFTIESTSPGSTTVTSGGGADTVNVKTIDGHTTVSTGAGNDTVNVTSDQSLLELGGLLTLDTGAGNDTVNVVDTAATGDTALTITGSSITGLGLPVLGEEQTIFVKAASGSLELLVPGYAPVTINYGDSAATVAAALVASYGFSDIEVTRRRRAPTRRTSSGSRARTRASTSASSSGRTSGR